MSKRENAKILADQLVKSLQKYQDASGYMDAYSVGYLNSMLTECMANYLTEKQAKEFIGFYQYSLDKMLKY